MFNLMLATGGAILLLILIQIFSGNHKLKLPISWHARTIWVVILIAIAIHAYFGFVYYFGK